MGISVAAYRAVGAFMAIVDKIRSIDALMEALGPPLAELSTGHIMCVQAFGFSALQDRKLLFGWWDTPWTRHYARNHYYIDDAMAHHALRLKDSGDCLWWSDLVADEGLTPTQRRIFEEAHTHGLKEGVVIPIHVRVDDEDRVLEYAYASFGGDFSRSDELANVLRLIIFAAHRTARRIYLAEARGGGFGTDIVGIAPKRDFSKLTAREREVLAWIVEGKQPKDVAEILGLQKSTVETHIKNVKKRYDFSTTGELITQLHRHKVFV